jgi:hypothetical protein
MTTARKLILISASLPLFAAPAVSFADQDTALEACYNAFVTANIPKEQKTHLRAIDPVRSPLDVHSRFFKITLSAQGMESGKQLAKATCIVKYDGTLISLNGKPAPTGELATLTSR